MIERTGTEQYTRALDIAHIFINIDKLEQAQVALDEARDIYCDLEIDAKRSVVWCK